MAQSVEEGDLRLKCYLVGTPDIRVIRVPPLSAEDEVVRRVSEGFELPDPSRVRLAQYEDGDGEKVTLRSDFWGGGEARLVYRHLRSKSDVACIKLWVRVAAEPASAARTTARALMTVSAPHFVEEEEEEEEVPPLREEQDEVVPPLREEQEEVVPRYRSPTPEMNFLDSHEMGEEEEEVAVKEERQTKVTQVTGEPPKAVTGGSRPLNWTRGQRIGRGGFGTVYVGVNKDTGDIFAVKQVELDEGNDCRARNLLRQYSHEIELMKSLSHQNVVRYLGEEIAGNTLSIFMEFVGGGSLASNLGKFGAFSENMIRAYSRQILSGISYLHANHILHRDVKCANILLDTSSNGKCVVKLTDFGCSRKLADSLSESQAHSVKGTAYFMAPEVLTGQGYDSSADVWSFGCTAVEMATTRPPCSAEFPDPAQALYQISQGTTTVHIPEHLSPLLRDLIAQCLQRDPKKRPEAAQLLGHEFFATNGASEASPGPSATSSDDPDPAAFAFLIRSVGVASIPAVALTCRSWRRVVSAVPFWESLTAQCFNCRGGCTTFKELLPQFREIERSAAVHVALKGHDKPITGCLCFLGSSPQSHRVVSSSEDKRIRVWNVEKGKCSRTLKRGNDSIVRSLCLAGQQCHPKLGLLFCAGDDSGCIEVFAAKSAKKLLSVSCVKRGQCVVGALCATGDRLFSLASYGSSYAVLRSHDLQTGVETDCPSLVTPACSIACQGTLLACGDTDGGINLWDIRSSKLVCACRAHSRAVGSLDFCRNSGFLFSGSLDATVKRWDSRFMRQDLCLLSAASVCSVSATSLFSASCGFGPEVCLWDTRRESCFKLLEGAQGALTSVSCSLDSSTIAAVGSTDRLVHAWTLRSPPTCVTTPVVESTRRRVSLREKLTSSFSGNKT